MRIFEQVVYFDGRFSPRRALNLVARG